MKTHSIIHLNAAGFLFLGGLFAQAQASPADDNNTGYLQVFTSTEQSQWGEGSYYFVHTGYRIYDKKGTAVKWVDNHATSADEQPEKVALAPGQYVVWAQSDKGYVKRTVTIKASQLTSLNPDAQPVEKTQPVVAEKSICRS